MPDEAPKTRGLVEGTEVTCAGCGRTYRAVPGDDYFNNTHDSTTDGVCSRCADLRPLEPPKSN